MWEGEVDDATLEFRIRLFAVPAAVAFAFVTIQSGFIASMSRIFLGMWIHEAGHAVTAWLCGLFAIPGPWRTAVGESRNYLVVLLVAAALGALAHRGWRHQHRGLMAAAALLFVVQLGCSFGLSPKTAQMLVTFGGDGGQLVLGTLLVATMYAGRDSHIHKGWLRWGFLVIGAFAFADAVQTWWQASKDFALIPFGRMEGTGLSDASRLVDWYGWDAGDLSKRYLRLASACGLMLTVLWIRGIVVARRARKRILDESIRTSEHLTSCRRWSPSKQRPRAVNAPPPETRA